MGTKELRQYTDPDGFTPGNRDAAAEALHDAGEQRRMGCITCTEMQQDIQSFQMQMGQQKAPCYVCPAKKCSSQTYAALMKPARLRYLYAVTVRAHETMPSGCFLQMILPGLVQAGTVQSEPHLQRVMAAYVCLQGDLQKTPVQGQQTNQKPEHMLTCLCR